MLMSRFEGPFDVRSDDGHIWKEMSLHSISSIVELFPNVVVYFTFMSRLGSDGKSDISASTEGKICCWAALKPVVPKFVRAVTQIKIVIVSYYPQCFAS